MPTTRTRTSPSCSSSSPRSSACGRSSCVRWPDAALRPDEYAVYSVLFDEGPQTPRTWPVGSGCRRRRCRTTSGPAGTAATRTARLVAADRRSYRLALTPAGLRRPRGAEPRLQGGRPTGSWPPSSSTRQRRRAMLKAIGEAASVGRVDLDVRRRSKRRPEMRRLTVAVARGGDPRLPAARPRPADRHDRRRARRRRAPAPSRRRLPRPAEALPRPPSSRDDGWRADIDAAARSPRAAPPRSVAQHATVRPGSPRRTRPRRASRPSTDDAGAGRGRAAGRRCPAGAAATGHTGIFPFIPGSGTHEYPLFCIVASSATTWSSPTPVSPYEDLIGTRDRGDRRPADRGGHGPASSRSRPATTRRTCSRTRRSTFGPANCWPGSGVLEDRGSGHVHRRSDPESAPRAGRRDRADRSPRTTSPGTAATR